MMTRMQPRRPPPCWSSAIAAATGGSQKTRREPSPTGCAAWPTVCRSCDSCWPQQWGGEGSFPDDTCATTSLKSHVHTKCVCVVSHSFWTQVKITHFGICARISQSCSHTGVSLFFLHLPSAGLASFFIATRVRPAVSLIDIRVDLFCF